VTDDVVARVLASARYRDVDRSLLERLAADELPRARTPEDAAKRVKRRLHQAVGAYRGHSASGAGRAVAEAWRGEWDAAMRDACRAALARHASTRERLPEIEEFYGAVWEATGGAPASVLDLGCGLNPLALPFMRLGRDALYLACDVDGRTLEEVEAFLELVGQPHRAWACDLVGSPPDARADVALLLKTVPLLDRQDAAATRRLLSGVRARYAVVSFPARSLGGHGSLQRTHAGRMAQLREDLAERLASSLELRFRSEVVYVLGLSPVDG
jgi:16S rRNA (guanine(1405)-N(7))-methyltransferase